MRRRLRKADQMRVTLSSHRPSSRSELAKGPATAGPFLCVRLQKQALNLARSSKAGNPLPHALELSDADSPRYRAPGR